MPPEPSPDSPFAERDAVDRLAMILRAARWNVEMKPGLPGGFRPDLLARRGSLRYAAQVKVARELRRPIIQGLFADAILQARAYASDLHVRPLAVIAAPRISPRIRSEIAAYARRFAGDIAWGMLDADGGCELHGDGLDGIHAPPAGRLARRFDPLSRRHADPFSDLGQWMLKVLLAPRLDPKHLAAPRVEVMSASHLAEVASVSLPSAARHLAELRRMGFLDEERRDVRLVRVAELLQSWRAANAGRVEEVRARWLIPPKDAAVHLDRALAGLARASPGRQSSVGQAGKAGPRGSRGCLGLFAASDRLGFHFVRGAPLHVYLEDVSSRSLESLGLAPAGEGQGVDVFVRRARFPESVFRACVAGGHAPAADLVQCWIDVSNHPARGRELADQIWRRVLGPRLADEAAS